MVVSENEMKLALEILRTTETPSLNHVLEAVLKFNSMEGQCKRLEFLKMNSLVEQLAHTFTTSKILPLKSAKKQIEIFEPVLAVA